jgi:cation:H+ antiporter
MDAADHDSLPAFSIVMEVFVIPLTVVTLGILALRALRARRAADGEANSAPALD